MTMIELISSNEMIGMLLCCVLTCVSIFSLVKCFIFYFIGIINIDYIKSCAIFTLLGSYMNEYI